MKYLDIKTIASGSSGNCYLVTDGKSSLLLDAGIPLKKIQEAIGYKTSDIDACLLTHEHGDHSRAVKDLMKLGVHVMATAKTLEALGIFANWDNIAFLFTTYNVKSFDFLPFPVEHDVAEPVGFLIQSRETGAKLVYATDTYYIKYRFSGITHLLIECNYVSENLKENIKSKSINSLYGKRVYQSHMSLETLKNFILSLEDSQLQEIHLIHLSDNNSDEERIRKEIRQLTGAAVFVH